MSVFRKLNTLFRAGARESAERLTDANAIRIYRQEIADAEHLLERRRNGLAGMIATRRDIERDIQRAEQRIARREASVSAIAPAARTEELLQLAARDISATESHLAALRQRHTGLCGRIDEEEFTLRKLLAEIREHRREAGLLTAEVARGGCRRVERYMDTVAGHLATLRETREGISGGVAAGDAAEAGMAEAVERIEGDPLDRHLQEEGLDATTRQTDAVLARLRNLGAG